MYGEEVWQINAQAMASMDAKGDPTETTTSIQSWVENLQLNSLSLLLTEELKLEPNYQRETGFGQQSGYYLDTTSMVNGLLVEKSILCKAEEMWIIQRNSVEDQKALVQQCIGAQISSPINTQRLMLINRSTRVPLLMISMYMDSIGMINKSTPILITMQIKSFKSTTQR